MTEPIRYVLDKPKEYFINVSFPKMFQLSTNAVPVKLDLFDGEDFFLNYENGSGWKVSEGRTGMSCTGGKYHKTKEAAEKFAQEKIVSYGVKDFQKMVEQQIGQHGLSPRYKLLTQEEVN